MLGKILFIFNRLREPSSYSAIAALLALAGANLPADSYNTVMNGLAVLFGIAGVFVAEGKPETKIKGFD